MKNNIVVRVLVAIFTLMGLAGFALTGISLAESTLMIAEKVVLFIGLAYVTVDVLVKSIGIVCKR